MFPWMYSMKDFYEFLNGDVNQKFLNGLRLFSPVINIKGDPAIEGKVISEVASYGKQLGVISEAILEIKDGKPGEAVKRLQDQVDAIEAIKEKHKKDLKEQAEEALNQLDDDELKEVLKKFS